MLMWLLVVLCHDGVILGVASPSGTTKNSGVALVTAAAHPFVSVSDSHVSLLSTATRGGPQSTRRTMEKTCEGKKF